jgi:hypothetical protein
LYVFSIDPLWADIQQKLVREEQLAKTLADAKTAQVKIDELKAQYESFPTGSEDDLRVLLPDSINPTRLIIDIEAVVNKRGLIMRGPAVSSAASVNDSSVAAHTFTFNVRAPYLIFRELMRDLEVSLALRDLATIGFTTSGADSTTPGNPENFVHTYNVSFTTYSLAE